MATFKTADVIQPYLKTKEMLIIEMTTTPQKGIRTYEQVDFQFGEDTLEVMHVFCASRFGVVDISTLRGRPYNYCV